VDGKEVLGKGRAEGGLALAVGTMVNGYLLTMVGTVIAA